MKTNIFFSLCLCVTTYYIQAQQDTLLYKQGKEQLDKKNYKKAIDCFTQAIGLNKKYVEAYYKRGDCFYEQKKPKKALKDYNMTIYLKPKDSDNYCAAGVVYAMMNNKEEAMMNYNKAIKYDSLNAAAWNCRASIFAESQECIKAEHDYLKAIKYGKKEEIGLYYTNLGEMYLEMKRYKNAIVELTHAIELNWPDKDIYLNRAKAYEAEGKTKEVEEDRKKAKEFKSGKYFQ